MAGPCRRQSAVAVLLGLRVRIPPVAWMSVSYGRCVLSGRGLCVRADHSSRGVLPNLVCLSVIVKSINLWSWSIDNEALAHWGAPTSWKCVMNSNRLAIVYSRDLSFLSRGQINGLLGSVIQVEQVCWENDQSTRKQAGRINFCQWHLVTTRKMNRNFQIWSFI